MAEILPIRRKTLFIQSALFQEFRQSLLESLNTKIVHLLLDPTSRAKSKPVPLSREDLTWARLPRDDVCGGEESVLQHGIRSIVRQVDNPTVLKGNMDMTCVGF